eukprot:CAMPEP_0177645050 /NCGR_PEP_ID=MMETSP0447-20121125/9037_1 /TAXON_ID=0 /ORGANISM="Stygamoeba regulata, Strain BSH-02190019" /LENGTH=607 /DNA_ID=CAMNT_0019147497 /DNA_START=249 /DNA_END=2072 /DNA_ORIENTATION=+
MSSKSSKDPTKKKSSSKKKTASSSSSAKQKHRTKGSKKRAAEEASRGKNESGFTGPPKIAREDIKLIERMGRGCFGTVYGGKCRNANVAIKIPNNQDEITAEKLEEFTKEVEIMSKIFNPNINLFMGACLEPGNIMIVTELMDGNVEQLLRSRVPLSLTTCMKMARDAAKGMAWLHGAEPKIIHRDLKSSNLLYTENEGNYVIKVCDFGLSELFSKDEVKQDQGRAIGSPLWMAPEVMRREVFDEKADVYSMGVVLWEFLTRQPPFPHHRDFDVFKHAVCEENERPPIPANTPSALKALIKRAWDADPKKRPSMPELEKELEQVIVDAAIPDVCGRKFWKTYFFDDELVENPIETVDWDEFAIEFYDFLESKPARLPEEPKAAQLLDASPHQLREFMERGRSQYVLACKVLDEHKKVIEDTIDPERLMERREWKALRQLLMEGTKDGRGVVRMESFGKMLGYLGPLEVKRGGAIVEGGFLHRLEQLLSSQWFFGKLDTEGAIANLKAKDPGTYLVRFSSQPGWFSISSVSPSKEIKHYRIRHKPAGRTFAVEGQETTYSSLIELIEKASGHAMLTTPCTNSPYNHLFLTHANAYHTSTYSKVDFFDK